MRSASRTESRLLETYEERVHPIDILYEAFTSYIIMGEDPRSFLPILRDMKLFIMSAARCWHVQSIWIQQRSAAGIAEDIFQKIKPVVVKELGKSDHFSVYMPAKPSKHEAFDPKKQLEAQAAKAAVDAAVAQGGTAAPAQKQLTKDEMLRDARACR